MLDISEGKGLREEWLKSGGDQWRVQRYLQRDLVDLENSCVWRFAGIERRCRERSEGGGFVGVQLVRGKEEVTGDLSLLLSRSVYNDPSALVVRVTT